MPKPLLLVPVLFNVRQGGLTLVMGPRPIFPPRLPLWLFVDVLQSVQETRIRLLYIRSTLNELVTLRKIGCRLGRRTLLFVVIDEEGVPLDRRTDM